MKNVLKISEENRNWCSRKESYQAHTFCHDLIGVTGYRYPKRPVRIYKRFGGISHSFFYFLYFFRTIHSFIHPFAEVPLLFPHCSSLSREPPWGAEPGFELRPAVQQADALLIELRRTLIELRRTLIELRRTL
jgi:hypothetical protein